MTRYDILIIKKFLKSTKLHQDDIRKALPKGCYDGVIRTLYQKEIIKPEWKHQKDGTVTETFYLVLNDRNAAQGAIDDWNRTHRRWIITTTISIIALLKSFDREIVGGIKLLISLFTSKST